MHDDEEILFLDSFKYYYDKHDSTQQRCISKIEDIMNSLSPEFIP